MTDDKKKTCEYLDRTWPARDADTELMARLGRKVSADDILDPPEFVIQNARQIPIK